MEGDDHTLLTTKDAAKTIQSEADALEGVATAESNIEDAVETAQSETTALEGVAAAGAGAPGRRSSTV